MKSSIGLFSAVLTSIGVLLACQNQADSVDEKAISMLRDFYTSYVTETSKVPWSQKKVDAILRQHCTDNLLRQWRELSDKMDYDLLIDSQFCQEDWLKRMVVSKDKIRENTYVVTFDYIVSDQKRQTKIKLQVTEKDGIVLIDKIILEK